jgi:formate dehydrogenase subunit delta
MRQDLLARVRARSGDLPPLLVSAAEHLVDGDVDRDEVRQPSGG